MKTFTSIFLFMLFYQVQQVAAVTIVECEDSQGERSFQASCPPGSTQVNTRVIRTGSNTEAATDNPFISATLYVVPDCDPCEDVREFLQARNVTVTIKDVSYEQAIQEELQALTGTLRAPVVVIGETIIYGYRRSDLVAALAAAGYTATE
jgi:glutaredoxin